MSKELAALNRMSRAFKEVFGVDAQRDFISTKEYKIIKKALTPPTEKEMCELLAKELKLNTIYFQDNYFYYNLLNREAKYKIVSYDDNKFYYATALSLETTHALTLFFKGE